jgi:hypothetical protein
MDTVQSMAKRTSSYRRELLNRSQRRERKKIGLSLTYFDQLHLSDAEHSFCGPLFCRTILVEVDEDDVGSNTTIEFFEPFYLSRFIHVSSSVKAPIR